MYITNSNHIYSVVGATTKEISFSRYSAFRFGDVSITTYSNFSNTFRFKVIVIHVFIQDL